MKHLSVALIMIGLTVGCGPTPPPPEQTPGAAAVPTDLEVEVGHREMIVTWVTVGDALISGYNIYISRNPLITESGWRAAVQPHNEAPFPGDLNPDDGVEHYQAGGLENGVKYYVAVRVIKADGTLSEPTGQEEVVLGGRGVIFLDYRYSGEEDGFSFALNEYVRADDDPNDIYYYTTDGQDYLASPIRLSGFQRDTRLAVLPYEGSFQQVSEQLMMSPVEPTEDNVPVEEGDWILARTADNQHALLEVRGFTGAGKDRVIELFYAFSSLTGSMFF